MFGRQLTTNNSELVYGVSERGHTVFLGRRFSFLFLFALLEIFVTMTYCDSFLKVTLDIITKLISVTSFFFIFLRRIEFFFFSFRAWKGIFPLFRVGGTPRAFFLCLPSTGYRVSYFIQISSFWDNWNDCWIQIVMLGQRKENYKARQIKK